MPINSLPQNTGTNANQVQGAIPDGAPANNYPVKVAGKDANGDVQTVLTNPDGSVVVSNPQLPPALTAAGGLKVSVIESVGEPANSQLPATKQGAFTDRSGSITTGGTAQQMMAANSSRRYLMIQNASVGALWINFTSAAVQDTPSIQIAAGGNFILETGFVSTEAVSVIGATTGQKWAAKEG